MFPISSQLSFKFGVFMCGYQIIVGATKFSY